MRIRRATPSWEEVRIVVVSFIVLLAGCLHAGARVAVNHPAARYAGPRTYAVELGGGDLRVGGGTLSVWADVGQSPLEDEDDKPMLFTGVGATYARPLAGERPLRWWTRAIADAGHRDCGGVCLFDREVRGASASFAAGIAAAHRSDLGEARLGIGIVMTHVYDASIGNRDFIGLELSATYDVFRR